jgi:hypothetical protein
MFRMPLPGVSVSHRERAVKGQMSEGAQEGDGKGGKNCKILVIVGMTYL